MLWSLALACREYLIGMLVVQEGDYSIGPRNFEDSHHEKMHGAEVKIHQHSQQVDHHDGVGSSHLELFLEFAKTSHIEVLT